MGKARKDLYQIVHSNYITGSYFHISVFSNLLFAVNRYCFLNNNRAFNDKNQISQETYAGQSSHLGQSWKQYPHVLVTNYDLHSKELKFFLIFLLLFLTLNTLNQREFAYKYFKSTSFYTPLFFSIYQG